MGPGRVSSKHQSLQRGSRRRHEGSLFKSQKALMVVNVCGHEEAKGWVRSALRQPAGDKDRRLVQREQEPLHSDTTSESDKDVGDNDDLDEY